MVAKTLQGLEDVLRDELIALGAKNVEIGLRMVSFEGDNAMMYRANVGCRTALSILKPIAKFTAYDPDELYDTVRDLDWSKYLSADSTFSIDSTVNSADFPHSRYVTYRVKDGIADHFYDTAGRRPSIRLDGADVQFNVHISDNRVTISLNSSGEPLNRRGYRVAQTDAPINEVLAAGIIMKTGWRGDCDFVDPMCGSGTFLIEAAMIARNISPGIFRKSFAFEKWPDFDSELFTQIVDEADEHKFEHKIYGGDIDAHAIAAARKNIREAGMDSCIELSCRPFSEWTEPHEAGILVTNPPYGERIKPENISELYRSIGSTLKQHFKGFHAWILGYKDEHFADIGLKPSVKFPILNGNLECSLREYVLFEGSLADFKTQGGKTANEDFNREKKPKARRLSDSEWTEETRKYGSTERRGRPRDKGADKPRRDFKKGSRSAASEGKGRRVTKGTTPRREPAATLKGRSRNAAYTVPGKAPKISQDQAVVFSKLPVRSRRGWKKATDSKSNNDNDITSES